MTTNRHDTFHRLMGFNSQFTDWTPDRLAEFRELLARACGIVAERAYRLRCALSAVEPLDLPVPAKEVYRAGCKAWLRSLLEEDNKRYHDVMTPYSLAECVNKHLPPGQTIEEKPDRATRGNYRRIIEETTAHLMDINALNRFGFAHMADILGEVESTLLTVSTFTNDAGQPLQWIFGPSVEETHEQVMQEHFARALAPAPTRVDEGAH